VQYVERISNLNITIVGLGLIGGSLAKAIRKNIEVNNLWAIDNNKNVLKISRKKGSLTKVMMILKFLY